MANEIRQWDRKKRSEYQGGASCTIPSSLITYIEKYYAYAYVSSYRGPRRKSHVNPFRRYKFDLDPTEWDIWVCNSGNGKTTGGFFHLIHWLTTAVAKDAPIQPDLHDLLDEYEFFREGTVNELYAKAKEPDLDLAPMLFELKQTLKFIYKIFQGFYQLVKGNPKMVVEFLRDPAGAWLTYRYAIMPLILQITDIIEFFEGGEDKQKVQEFRETTQSTVVDTTVSPNRQPVAFSTRVIDTVKCGSALWIKSAVDPAPLGTGIIDVVRGVWEVIPFSFIFDWFVAVGTWLDSLRDVELEIEKSYATLIVNRRTETRYKESTYWNHVISGPTEIPYVTKSFLMDRKIDVSPSALPGLTGVKLSTLRQIDSIALLIRAIVSLLRK